MNTLDELGSALDKLMPPASRPVVVFSASWPVLRELNRVDQQAVDELLGVVLEAAGGRSILFPTFSAGYQDGICNLDFEPSTAGVLSETFRRRASGVRTLSAFFSFKVEGPAASELEECLPSDAWGEKSIYEWMEESHARFIMLGAHPTHCSYLHRLEWLERDRLPYRTEKTFSGMIARGGRVYDVQERLLVRCLNPPAINDFTGLIGVLENAGMQRDRIGRIELAAYDALPVRDALRPLLRENPLLFLENPEDFEEFLP